MNSAKSSSQPACSAWKRRNWSVQLAIRPVFEPFVSPVQQRQLPADHLPEIDLLVREIRHILQVVLDQQSFFQQRFRADQVRVAGKCRKTLVRAVAIAGRS